VTSHPHRLPNVSYIGEYRYSLRFSTHARQHLFVSADVVDLVRAQLQRAAVETSIAMLAYCFMPDHVHLMVEGNTPTADCRRFISLGKQYSGFYYARRFGGRLWLRYGFERVLRESEPTADVIRYVLENPVRAGLVGR
jgi:putative transposase